MRKSKNHSTLPGLPSRMLTRSEVAEYLAVSGNTIDNMVARGELPRVRFGAGRVIRYRPEDVARLAVVDNSSAVENHSRTGEAA